MLFCIIVDIVCCLVWLFFIELWLIDDGVGYYLVLNNCCDLCGGLFEIDELLN